MAGEFRHGTSVPTFLISPRRRDVVVAKLVTITGLGAVVGAISFGLALAVAGAGAGTQRHPSPRRRHPQMWVGATVATALFGALGVALGAITRNMVIAIIGAIGWTYLIEGVILSQHCQAPANGSRPGRTWRSPTLVADPPYSRRQLG